MFRQELLPYLTVYDIVKLDNACMNNEYRLQLLEKINGVILPGDKSMEASLFKWLRMRRIYLMNMFLYFEDDCTFLSSIEINYVGQLRHHHNFFFLISFFFQVYTSSQFQPESANQRSCKFIGLL